jgi:nucleoprotein TPR
LFRSQELTEQNELLHRQLETLTAQADRIRQTALSTVETEAGAGGGDEDAEKQLSDLRRVISHLRKEQEMRDLRLEVAKQEQARLKAEVDHLTRVGDETRARLSEVSATLADIAGS